MSSTLWYTVDNKESTLNPKDGGINMVMPERPDEVVYLQSLYDEASLTSEERIRLWNEYLAHQKLSPTLEADRVARARATYEDYERWYNTVVPQTEEQLGKRESLPP